MKLVIIIGLGILYCLVVGLIVYVITISLIPDRFKYKFFSVVPFFPKMPYSIILYLIAGILYSAVVSFYNVTETIVRIVIIIISVLVSSLVVKKIAKLRNDNLEETMEEEVERKRKL